MNLPPATGPLVAFYGDDFTGSAAVAEALDLAGFPTVLFLGTPTAATQARFAGYRCFGIAGDARTRSPAWMDAELPGIFAALRAYGAPILQYKMCSTLDSAPHLGSVGRAAEIGVGDWAPLIVASPRIGRYQAFGTLFARSPSGVVRLDRHPTMAVHPVTPMQEADVRRHLARQTALSVGLVDVLDLWAGRGAEALQRARDLGHRIVAMDLMDEASQIAVGQVLWQAAQERPLFGIGSQGLDDALISAWVAAGHRVPPPVPAGAVARIAVVSGSCSPDTAVQITCAEARGFTAIRVDAAQAVGPAAWAAECARAEALALAALSSGRDPLLFTARGPDDLALGTFAQALRLAGGDPAEINTAIGTGLGRILRRLADRAGLTRVAIAGGDTSSHAAGELGLVAMTVAATIGPAVPLLNGHHADPARAPLQLSLKGGQMGGPDLFAAVRDGA